MLSFGRIFGTYLCRVNALQSAPEAREGVVERYDDVNRVRVVAFDTFGPMRLSTECEQWCL